MAVIILDEVTGIITLSMVRGDAEDLIFTVTDDADPPAVVNLGAAVDATPSRPAVIRFAVKKDPEIDENDDALAYKTSADSAEIAIATQSGGTIGQCTVLLDNADTRDAEAGNVYRWDLEVSRQDALRAGASVGTAATAANGTVTGTGTAFTKAKKGDIFHPTSGSNSGKPGRISKITSDTSMVVEFPFAVGSGATFEIRRALTKTVARGPFELVQDTASA